MEALLEAISDHLKSLGMIEEEENWVPYEMKSKNVKRRFCTCGNCSEKKYIYYATPKKRKSKRSRFNLVSQGGYSRKKNHSMYKPLLVLYIKYDWFDWAEHSKKNTPSTIPNTTKFFCMIMLVHVLRKYWKHSMENS